MEVIEESEEFNYEIEKNKNKDNDKIELNYNILINNLNIDKEDSYLKLIKSEIDNGSIQFNKKYWDKYLSWTKQNL